MESGIRAGASDVARGAAASMLAGGLLSWTAQGSAASGRRTAAPAAAHLWLTTADGQYKLTDMGEVPFGTGQPTVPTVVVDPSRTFQTMEGFGGAITDSSAVVLYRMSPAGRAAAMQDAVRPPDRGRAQLPAPANRGL